MLQLISISLNTCILSRCHYQLTFSYTQWSDLTSLLCIFCSAGAECRASQTPNEHSVAELHPSPDTILIFVRYILIPLIIKSNKLQQTVNYSILIPGEE